jgi:coproporphyrinogen III oxidase-like Fe-S oxidoreductase
MVYWTNQNWLGLGPSAASHIDGRRWKNQPSLGKYLAGAPDPPTQDHEELPPRQRIGEQIMLGLRLREGLKLDWINDHIPQDDARQQTIDEMIQLSLLERTKTHLRLTHQGLFLADSVIAKLL